MLGRRLGSDEVGNRLSLAQIHASVRKAATCELARFGQSAVGVGDKGLEQRLLHIDGTMTGNLYNILARKTVGGAIEGANHVVEHVAAFVNKLPEGQCVGGASGQFVSRLECLEMLADKGNGIRSADANDGNAAQSLGCRNGCDGHKMQREFKGSDKEVKRK